jgi:hypothetical protein
MLRPFNLAPCLFPIFSGRPGPDMLRISRFIGMGFWLDRKGHFATCKHVLQGLAPDEVPAIGQPTGPNQDHFFPVHGSKLHPTFDIAVGQAPASAVGSVLKMYEGSVGLGLEVQAFGYTDGGRAQSSYQVDPRLLRGHVTRVSEDSYGLPSPSLLEVSFGSPSGFSGTPLLVETEVVGILYSNLDSRLQAYSMEEIVEGQSQIRETAYRIYEYGIAHRASDLSSFFAACDVGQ